MNGTLGGPVHLVIFCSLLFCCALAMGQGKSDAATKSHVKDRSLEILRLEKQIEKDFENYKSRRPWRRFVGLTMEPRFGYYVEKCLQKILDVSATNYPQELKGVYGSVRLTISIQADGTIEQVEVSKPSGNPLIDAAAERLVRLAAPFEPFPDDVRKDTDILSIIKTFNFTTSDDKRFSPGEPLWKPFSPAR